MKWHKVGDGLYLSESGQMRRTLDSLLRSPNFRRDLEALRRIREKRMLNLPTNGRGKA
jgi:hypothetical protein